MWRCLKNIIYVFPGLCLIVLLLPQVLFAAEGDENTGGEIVVFSKGQLNIDAREVRSEEIMKEIGEKCGIKIVVFGEVFSEVPVSLKLQKQSVRKGIERMLRVANITNFLMHFEDGDNGSHIVELDLIGKKGGERHLTEGAERQSKPDRTQTKKDAAKRVVQNRSLKDMADKDEVAKIQENFLNIMDEVLSAQLGEGEEPDPAEILRLFKEVVPQEMKDQIPPEVLEELEKLE